MGFSEEWDKIYSANQQLSIWPWSDLVSYVMRYVRPAPGKVLTVLELGCGAGANIPFFLHLNAEYYATEGSPAIVANVAQKYPALNRNIKVADFTKEIPFDMKFDLIFDRASVTHNDLEAIKNCIKLSTNLLKDNGMFIGIDWFSTLHSEFKNGEVKNKDDGNTKEGFTSGQFANVGRVHFSDKAHLETLFSGFNFIKMEHKVVYDEIPANGYQFASWNFAAKKR